MKEPVTREYMPQLDSLRAIAVFCVMLAHYTPYNAGGSLAVRLFFVLSGFLITRILLDARAAQETRGTTMGHELRVFFSRRLLRLYPPLIIAIGLGTLFAVDSLRTTWWWHITYLSNVYFAIRREWEGALTQFWSLSVEEQFYLVWPFVIFLVPYKRLATTVVALILSAGVFNLAMFLLNVHWMTVYVLPFHNFDALGLGALLGISYYRPDLSPISERRLKTLGLVAGAAGMVVLPALVHFGYALRSNAILKDSFAALLFMWIVGSAARGVKGPVGAALNLGAVRYLGRISYGLYVYHNFVQDILYGFWTKAGIPIQGIIPIGLMEWSRVVAGPYDRQLYELVMLGLKIATAVALASLSWFAVERPLSMFRKRIGTSEKPRSVSASATPAYDGAGTPVV
jgi:peptidoglycan/LPS O-acetylase OafA/YrhL